MPRTNISGIIIALILIIDTLSFAMADTSKSAFLLNKPFLFSYGTWQKGPAIIDGAIDINGMGVTPKGGAGCNVAMDLSAYAEDSPSISIKSGDGNTLKHIKLLLLDDKGNSGAYIFDVPGRNSSYVRITPEDGAAFNNPNLINNMKLLDLSHITQWQITGDWGGDGVVNVMINSISAISPSQEILSQRSDLAKRKEVEIDRLRQENNRLMQLYGHRNKYSPSLQTAYLVAPDILAIRIKAGHVIRGGLSKYTPLPADKKKVDGQQLILVRNGKDVGWLIGSHRGALVKYDGYVGDPLLDQFANAPSTYTILSPTDSYYRQGRHPVDVWRKSKPINWQQPSGEFTMLHTIYLHLPKPLHEGVTYTISFGDLNVRQPRYNFTLTPSTMWSEAVHTSQIGFRPHDPEKRAYLSIWLGAGGSYAYPPKIAFQLLDNKTNHVEFQGIVKLSKAADQPELMWKDMNFNDTNVYYMDFSKFDKLGTYRLYVKGIGCGYPFAINRNVWRHAFITQMMGFYNERSGITLGPPYSSFHKPRDFYPGDGVKVYLSRYSILDGGDSQKDLAAQATNRLMPQAWGGYHDAGDWNPRRITHMRATMAQLELLQMFPKYYGKLNWKIPATCKAPSILQEALFELDLFHRLQFANGSVSFGIETNGDPYPGEVSWKQSMTAYVYAPDIWSTFIYAGVAARASYLLNSYDPQLAKVYRLSAEKAMAWAESDWNRRKKTGDMKGINWNVMDDRNLAAVEMYQLDGNRKWLEIFMENTCLKDENPNLFVWSEHVQDDAAFAYSLLPKKMTDAVIRSRAITATLQQANKALEYASGNAFNLTTPDKGKPMFLGFYSEADAIELARAHYLTGAGKYLAGTVQACNFESGCNPNNMTYTVDLGVNWPRNPLQLDSRLSGQNAPEGITVYGNYDFINWNQDWACWPLKWYLSKICIPNAYNWPIPEAYFDIFLYPATNEFTVDNWTPNVYVWGYLSARH